MTEKKVGLLTTIRKLFDEHEILTLKKLYELLGDRMAESDDTAKFKHRVRASINTLKEKKELVHVEKGKWKKA